MMPYSFHLQPSDCMIQPILFTNYHSSLMFLILQVLYLSPLWFSSAASRLTHTHVLLSNLSLSLSLNPNSDCSSIQQHAEQRQEEEERGWKLNALKQGRPGLLFRSLPYKFKQIFKARNLFKNCSDLKGGTV